MTATTTGFIGIGNMGLGMALRLRDLGFAVGVRDIDPEREATAARTPRFGACVAGGAGPALPCGHRRRRRRGAMRRRAVR